MNSANTDYFINDPVQFYQYNILKYKDGFKNRSESLHNLKSFNYQKESISKYITENEQTSRIANRKQSYDNLLRSKQGEAKNHIVKDYLIQLYPCEKSQIKEKQTEKTFSNYEKINAEYKNKKLQNSFQNSSFARNENNSVYLNKKQSDSFIQNQKNEEIKEKKQISQLMKEENEKRKQMKIQEITVLKKENQMLRFIEKNENNIKIQDQLRTEMQNKLNLKKKVQLHHKNVQENLQKFQENKILSIRQQQMNQIEQYEKRKRTYSLQYQEYLNEKDKFHQQYLESTQESLDKLLEYNEMLYRSMKQNIKKNKITSILKQNKIAFKNNPQQYNLSNKNYFKIQEQQYFNDNQQYSENQNQNLINFLKANQTNDKNNQNIPNQEASKHNNNQQFKKRYSLIKINTVKEENEKYTDDTQN